MKCTAVLICEKIIIDKDGAHSIINVMLNAGVVMQEMHKEDGESPARVVPLTIPPNATTPNQWWVYSAWAPSSEDVDKDFEQVYQAYWPNGEKFAEARLPFTQKSVAMQQTTFSFVGFPVGQEGRVQVRTWLDSGGYRATEIADTFVDIKHGLPENMAVPKLT